MLEIEVDCRLLGGMVGAECSAFARDPMIPITLMADAAARMLSLPLMADGCCMLLETCVYNFIGMLSPQYDGGYGNFYYLSNCGFYMAVDSDVLFELGRPNAFEGTVLATRPASSHEHLPKFIRRLRATGAC